MNGSLAPAFRQSMVDAHVIPSWVDNQPFQTASKDTFTVINGQTEKTLHLAANASKDVVNAATKSSWTAFQSWRQSSLAARRDLLLRFADVLEQRAAKIIQSTVEETSCDAFFARLGLGVAIDRVRETAAHAMSIYGTVVPGLDDPAIHGFVYREAVGPGSGHITDQQAYHSCLCRWNTPVFLAARTIAQAVAAGCSVLLKASELCPRTHFLVVEAFKDAGAPAGLLNSLQAKREDAVSITEALIASKAIRKIDFIGSTAVGREIAALAGKHLKPAILELGGKCPAIVLEDADLDSAAALCVTGGLMYHGQLCLSTERLIVHKQVAEKFKKALIKAIEKQPGGQGNAVNAASAQHAYDVLNDAKKCGHKFLYGDAKFETATTLMPAVVECPKGSRMEDEEVSGFKQPTSSGRTLMRLHKTFGPSMSLYVIDSEREAIDLANASEYGYAASIHTRDMDRAIKIARQLDFGIVNCNNLQFFTHANAPTGGTKATGWGRSNGMWGIGNFLDEKSFTYKSPTLPKPIVDLSVSLYTTSKVKAALLKKDEEIARESKRSLNLPVDKLEPRPPVPPRVFDRLLRFLDKALSDPSDTPAKKRGRPPGSTKDPAKRARLEESQIDPALRPVGSADTSKPKRSSRKLAPLESLSNVSEVSSLPGVPRWTSKYLLRIRPKLQELISEHAWSRILHDESFLQSVVLTGVSAVREPQLGEQAADGAPSSDDGPAVVVAVLTVVLLYHLGPSALEIAAFTKFCIQELAAGGVVKTTAFGSVVSDARDMVDEKRDEWQQTPWCVGELAESQKKRPTSRGNSDDAHAPNEHDGRVRLGSAQPADELQRNHDGEAEDETDLTEVPRSRAGPMAQAQPDLLSPKRKREYKQWKTKTLKRAAATEKQQATRV
ncbi:MAG: hypothetical protein Q9162_004577 [Coniocarpon cinnabarinum]